MIQAVACVWAGSVVVMAASMIANWRDLTSEIARVNRDDHLGLIDDGVVVKFCMVMGLVFAPFHVAATLWGKARYVGEYVAWRLTPPPMGVFIVRPMRRRAFGRLVRAGAVRSVKPAGEHERLVVRQARAMFKKKKGK